MESLMLGGTTNVVELKKIMVEKRLEKITALSLASGVTQKTLGLILSGRLQPSSVIMKKLIAALEIPPAKAGEIFFSDNFRAA